MKVHLIKQCAQNRNRSPVHKKGKEVPEKVPVSPVVLQSSVSGCPNISVTVFIYDGPWGEVSHSLPPKETCSVHGLSANWQTSGYSEITTIQVLGSSRL